MTEELLRDKRKAERERDEFKSRMEVMQSEMENQHESYQADL